MKFSKLRKFASVAMVAGMVVVAAGTGVVSADTVDSKLSNAKVVFNAGGGGEGDPEDPTDPENPLDPDDPDDPDITHNNGELVLVVTPNLNFGLQKTSVSDQTVWAQPLKVSDNHSPDSSTKGNWEPKYVQVKNDRGTAEGWKLTVKQNEQFKTSSQDGSKELTGAVLTFTNGSLSSNQNKTGVTAQQTVSLATLNSSVVVMDAAVGSSDGNFINKFGNQQKDFDPNDPKKYPHENISLFIKGGSAKKLAYSTTLDWNLENVPVPQP
ncbi:MAG: WxL domain-containing protein [Clostridioides sp.]|jgi:hypothetical protein|nr:WxL domain-containing protein [Clostridioides sp.]